MPGDDKDVQSFSGPEVWGREDHSVTEVTRSAERARVSGSAPLLFWPTRASRNNAARCALVVRGCYSDNDKITAGACYSHNPKTDMGDISSSLDVCAYFARGGWLNQSRFVHRATYVGAPF